MISPHLRALIEAQLQKLKRVRFVPDPLFPNSLPRQLEASAIKRHGPLIEAAIIEALGREPDYQIWTDSAFIISAAADHAVQAQNADDIALTRLPYGIDGRALQIDLLAYSYSRRRLGAYEIKRGHGHHDSSKLRSMRRDLYAVQTTLASYGVRHGLSVDDAISRVIFYFGNRSLPPPWSLAGAELDVHFGCSVRQVVDEMTAYYRAGLENVGAGLDEFRPELRQMALTL